MKKFIVYWLCLLATTWILITLEIRCRNPLVNVGFGGFFLQVVGGFTLIFKLKELVYGKK